LSDEEIRAGNVGVVDADTRDTTAGNGSGSLTSEATDDPTIELEATRPDRPRRKIAPHRIGGVRGWVGSVLIAWAAVLIGFVLFVAFLSAFSESRAQSGLQRHFATLLTDARAPVGGTISTGTPVARLDIPAIGLHQIVVEGAGADQLRKGPGHVSISPLPGQPGNSVIAAHALAYGGPFGSIGSLRPGDIVRVLTGEGQSTYRVADKLTVPASNTKLFQATRDNRLTLVTSADLWGSSRTVVTARLIGKVQPAPAGKPTVLRPSQAGLAGGGGAGPALALWLEILLVVAVATVVAYRRLPHWSAYVITTPIVLAGIWLVYTTLGRLLPATL
jgi:sortase A